MRFARSLLPLAIGLMLQANAPVVPGAGARIRADVTYLAADGLEGRAAGTRGHELGAAYVAARLKAAGLEPAGERGTFVQTVPLRRASLVAGSTVARLAQRGRWRPLAAAELQVAPSVSHAAVDITAGLVFAGYGIDEPTLGRSDYEGLDVRGKIVVAFAGAPPGLGADIAAFVKSQKAGYAAARGAVGFVEIPTWPPPGGPTDAAPLVAEAVNGWASVIQAGPASVAGPTVLSLSPKLTERLFEGARRPLAAARRAALAGRRPAGFALSGQLALSTRSRWQDPVSSQIYARLPGSDPAFSGQSIVLIAHLDHLGRVVPPVRGDDIDNGALDNAAGVATLIEVAQQLAGRPGALRRSVVILITTGEELGDVGSDYAARHFPAAAGRPVATLDVDMPLLLYHFTDVAAPGADHSAIGPAIEAAGRPLGVALAPDPMPQQELIVRSDQLRFIERGIPSALLVTGYANGGRSAWADYLARHYHQPSDDLTQPIRWDEAERLAALIAGIGRRLADQQETPGWNSGDFFARRAAARGESDNDH